MYVYCTTSRLSRASIFVCQFSPHIFVLHSQIYLLCICCDIPGFFCYETLIRLRLLSRARGPLFVCQLIRHTFVLYLQMYLLCICCDIPWFLCYETLIRARLLSRAQGPLFVCQLIPHRLQLPSLSPGSNLDDNMKIFVW